MTLQASFGSLYFDSVSRRQTEEQHTENAGRLAEAAATFLTSGAGQVVAERPLGFPTPFIEPPSITYGHVVEVIPDPELWQQPRCTGGVARWLQDEDDFYIGFYPFASIAVAPQPLTGEVTAAQVVEYRTLLAENPPIVEVTHHYSFRGQAYKELSQQILEGLAF